MIYFDNAATGGKRPQIVIDKVNFALKNLNANPGRSGHKTAQIAADYVYKTRLKIADFFGINDAENVVFTMNCTHSINCVLKGVLKAGDHIIVSSLEHNAVMRPLASMKISYSVAEVSLNDNNITVENFRKLIKPNTKMIFCTAASNVLGKILPLEEIGKLACENNIYFGVDAAQAAGIIPIDIKKMNIDFLCVAPHKGLFAPAGIGVLIAKKPIEKTIIEGGTGTNSLDFIQPDFLPERLESGTLNILGIMGISGGIEFIKKTGIKNNYLHETELAKRTFKFLKSNGYTVYCDDFIEGEFVPVISFNYKNINSEIIASALAKEGIATRGGYHCAPTAHKQMGTTEIGAVRLSFSPFNTHYEVDFFEKILKNKKFIKNIEKLVE